MQSISPAVKGLITGALMIALSYFIYASNQPADSPLQYAMFAIYGVGIIWTLISHTKTEAYKNTFGDLFSQGFKCFIIVTLMMVLYYWLFFKLNPRLIEESAETFRQFLIEKGGKLEAEIERDVKGYKENFTVSMVSITIFQQLLVGAVLTAIAAVLIRLKNN